MVIRINLSGDMPRKFIDDEIIEQEAEAGCQCYFDYGMEWISVIPI